MAPLANCRQPRVANLDWWQEASSGVDRGLAALISLPRGLDRGNWSVARPRKLLKELDEGKAGAGQGCLDDNLSVLIRKLELKIVSVHKSLWGINEFTGMDRKYS